MIIIRDINNNFASDTKTSITCNNDRNNDTYYYTRVVKRGNSIQATVTLKLQPGGLYGNITLRLFFSEI